jgi:uncharacterized protein with ParB-like and HNH nuclease domain
MQAKETKIQSLLDSTRQYVIPLFQRPYSWETKHWEALWQDLAELCEEEQPRSHFIGSIVNMPSRSVPEGVTKYVLIDGQQRLTTIVVLLAAIRDHARRQEGNLADKIDDILLKNRHQEGTDAYKLLPTQVDRPAFRAIIDAGTPPKDDPVSNAYRFYDRKLRLNPQIGLEKLYNVVRNHLVLVSIVLDKDDNPYLIFESLNAKGKPLAQADLIRNFFFMRLHPNSQERMYDDHWRPMQESLGDSLTEFIRHFLMRDGGSVKKDDVYVTLKDRIENHGQEQIVAYLKELATFAKYYARLLDPKRVELRPAIAERLDRLNRNEATTAYPFLLRVYHDLETDAVSGDEFAAVLDCLETFLLRRFVCGVATSGLNRVFPQLYGQAIQIGGLVDGVRTILADKNFPRDQQFREHFGTAKIYGGDRSPKARLILDRIEVAYGHKEQVDLGPLTIEHVMPRTPTEWWQRHLGEDWEAVHAEWLDTVGNLTLTGYNSEMSNGDFDSKRVHLQESHCELNRHFIDVETWDEQAIARRGEILADQALKIWPDFSVPTTDSAPAMPVDSELQEDIRDLIARVIAHFGGEVDRVTKGIRVFYKLGDGKLVNIKYSKKHLASDNYWFDVHVSLLADMELIGITHIVFILVPDSFVVLPRDVLMQYLAEAGSSPKSDGSVRHYHVLISAEAVPMLFHHGKPERISTKPYLISFDQN